MVRSGVRCGNHKGVADVQLILLKTYKFSYEVRSGHIAVVDVVPY